MTPSFVHLRVHTEYSIVDGIVRINEYLSRCKELNVEASALTDFMNLFGLVKFYKKALSVGCKPIIGVDILIQVAEDSIACTLLCKNQIGYRHAVELISKAYMEGNNQGQPIIQWDWLCAHREGLIVLSGAEGGDIGKAILQGEPLQAEAHLQRWLEVFPNHFYIELIRTQKPEQEKYISEALRLAEKFQVPVVATNDVRFIRKDDFHAHEARVCIHEGEVLNDPRRLQKYTPHQYLKSTQEMHDLFADIPEALMNTVEVAKRCTVSITLGQVFLPKFPTPNHESVDVYFQQKATSGLNERLNQLQIRDPNTIARYRERLDRELGVIIAMGFPGYFLIVADFISWAKRQHIPVGPGRGSGAGSLIAFSLGITELDPLQHELLFERFLNPERVSMPDFDVDFCMEGRDRVIEYVSNRYGHHAVAQIITYGTMAAKAVVRDVGRVLGYPYGFVDKIAKLIPFELGMTLHKALQQEDNLKKRYESEDEVKTLIDLAKKLEGITRNAGKHAGGVVIAPTRLTDYVPLYCEKNTEQTITQLDKDDVESIGLIKFDFLGLRTLTIINWTLITIHENRHEAIDINTIPLDDTKTFDLLKNCATTAVFQLESRGMKELIRRLQPDCFGDITALVALFRPGPLQSGMVDDFIDRKHGRSRVHYPHPDLEPILQPTYGVILYQEQVMQIAQVLAGYTLGGADILRRAMGKKKPEEMAKQRLVFLQGALKRGIETKVAEYIFDLMEKFAGYGFNKSHSAAYALIAYQTAWLKTHFPAEFMAAVLSSDMDNTDKVVGFIHEAQTMNLHIHPPDINTGWYHFTVNAQGEIRYGLGAIKGVGQSLIQSVIDEREKNGTFKSLFDLCERLDKGKLTRRALEPLVKSGALDEFNSSRSTLFFNIEKALKYACQSHRNITQGQGDLFSLLGSEGSQPVSYMECTSWSVMERLQFEKEVLGLYFSGHPLDTCQEELKKITQKYIGELYPSTQAIIIAGIVIAVRVITTKTGKRMAILTLEDKSGRLDITLFSEVYNYVSACLEDAAIFLVKGVVSKDEYSGGIKMVAEAMMTLDEARERMAKTLAIRIQGKETSDRVLSELPPLINQFGQGSCPIKLIYQNAATNAELKLGEAWNVKPNSQLLEQLYLLYGHENVFVEYM